MHSAKNIKILYDCEGYYVNDVDDRIAVHGTLDASFDDEYVAFDLETTGLSSQHDTIIEIGAAIMKRDQVIDTFQTFVAPGRQTPSQDHRAHRHYRPDAGGRAHDRGNPSEISGLRGRPASLRPQRGL